MDKEKFIESLNRLLKFKRITQEQYDIIILKINK